MRPVVVWFFSALSLLAAGCTRGPEASVAPPAPRERTPPAPPPPPAAPEPSGDAALEQAAAATTEVTASEPAGGAQEEDELTEDATESPPSSGRPPAMHYGGLDRASCEAELGKRKVAFVRVESARGVVAPVRLRGPLSGVTFRANLPSSKRDTATIEIYDCRLVLALDDFAKILSKHDIVEVVHLSVYRPPRARTRKSKDKKRRVRIPPPRVGTRHGGALAIDAAIFKTSDGRTLDVKKDFHGRIGAKTCPPPRGASELRQIACEAGDAQLFNVVLTPDYNRAHRNHFHLEVTARARWFFVH